MDRVELAQQAENILEMRRDSLLIDAFFKINIEIVEGDFHSQCIKDLTSPLSWIIKLDPEKHADEYDVQYSIVESLVRILMESLSGEEKDGIVARISTAICNRFQEEEDYSDDDSEE